MSGGDKLQVAQPDRLQLLSPGALLPPAQRQPCLRIPGLLQLSGGCSGPPGGSGCFLPAGGVSARPDVWEEAVSMEAAEHGVHGGFRGAIKVIVEHLTIWDDFKTADIISEMDL